MPATTSILSNTSSSRKRKLTEDDYSPHTRKKLSLSSISAVLSTVNSEGIIDKLVIKVDHPLTIGRHPNSDYVLNEKTVSSRHCTIHAVLADTGKVSIVCQDFSSNGIIVNGHPFTKHRSILLMDGDYLQISGSQVFHCEQVRRERSQLSPHLGHGLAEPQVVGQYSITRHTLGRGAYSAVNLAIDLKERKQVACKIIQQRSQADVTDVLREVELLKKLRHPNINAVYGFSSSGEVLRIFLELATGGDLFSYIAKHKVLCEGEAKYITFQLMKGLEYLHQKRISHRDLKPENILLATPGAYPRILIADFGLAKERAFELTGNVAGTISYLPPEAVTALARKTKYNTEMSDSWALGLIIFIMLQGYHPFDSRRKAQISSYPLNNCGELDTTHQSEEIVRRRIVQKLGILHWSDWQRLSLAKDFVSNLLVRDAKHRQTVGAAMSHDWIRQDLPSLMKAYNKLVASEVKST
ncbi:kinase-like protein [Serendipita vermifera]|nr:kinase-like protein [Serendipita vermifera]